MDPAVAAVFRGGPGGVSGGGAAVGRAGHLPGQSWGTICTRRWSRRTHGRCRRGSGAGGMVAPARLAVRGEGCGRGEGRAGMGAPEWCHRRWPLFGSDDADEAREPSGPEGNLAVPDPAVWTPGSLAASRGRCAGKLTLFRFTACGPGAGSVDCPPIMPMAAPDGAWRGRPQWARGSGRFIPDTIGLSGDDSGRRTLNDFEDWDGTGCALDLEFVRFLCDNAPKAFAGGKACSGWGVERNLQAKPRA